MHIILEFLESSNILLEKNLSLLLNISGGMRLNRQDLVFLHINCGLTSPRNVTSGESKDLA